MFNSLAYNCDFQDAIGNIAPPFKSQPNQSLTEGAAHEAAYWGSSSPGKRSIGSTFPKNSQRDSAYPRHSPEGERFPGHRASRDTAGYPSIA